MLILQVDTEEIDRLSGRVRVNRGKYSNRYGNTSSTIQKPVSQSTATTAKRDRTESVPETTPAAVETPQPQQATSQPVVPLPKQSGFVPRQRIVSYKDDDDTAPPAAAAPTAKTKAISKQEKSENDSDVTAAPVQSCFLQRKWDKEKEKQREEEIKMLKKKEEREQQQAAKDNISLKDSIEKVKSWKEQLVSSIPAKATAPKGGPSDELDINAIIGNQDEWRKKKPIGRPGQTVANEPNDEDQRPPQSTTAGRKTAAKKTYGGVPAFPDESTIIAHDHDSSKLMVPKTRANRSPSPYDNLRNQRPSSPYDNCQTVYPSMESLGGFAGDVSGSSDDESQHGTVSSSMRSQQSSKSTGRNIPLNKTVASSLPDLVTSSEGGRRSPMVGGGNKFIGRVQDIDSLLGFGETEDETDDVDNDYGSVMSAPSRSDVSSCGINGRTAANAMPISPDEEHGPMSYTHLLNSAMYSSDSQDDRIFIGDIEDIDSVFGNDLVPTSLGSSSMNAMATSPVIQQPRGNFGAPLHVVIGQQQSVDLGSSDSLLDTPVPDTPDVPLSPVPAFFLCDSKHKNDNSSMAIPSIKLQSEETGNNVDLADRSSDSDDDSDDDGKSLDLVDSKSNGSRTDCDGQSVVDSVPTATLIDLDFTQESDSPDDEDEIENEAAVAAIEARQAANGQVTIGDIVEICRRVEQSCKPPWIEEEEDRRFVGYNNVMEALESMDINVGKVNTIIICSKFLFGMASADWLDECMCEELAG